MQAVYAAAGGFIGFLLGGPAGAAIGLSIGLGVGASFTSYNVQGAKLGEITTQSSREGEPRVIPIGIARPIGGQLIASSDVTTITTEVEQGGKGGPSITTSYDRHYRTYAIGVCEGPIGGFRRIWRNNRLVYDERPGSSWGAINNGEFLKNTALYNGDFEQVPSSALEEVYGVGEVPAFRGTAYMVRANEDLTAAGGAIPTWLFEVCSSHDLKGCSAYIGCCAYGNWTPLVFEIAPKTVPQNKTGQDATTLFQISGGIPPYTWEIIDMGPGWHNNISFLYEETEGPYNWLQTPSGCGTFEIRVSDACGELTHVCAVLASGAWRPYLEASLYYHPQYPTPIPVGGGVIMSGDESEGDAIRTLLMTEFGDAGLNDGTQANIHWINNYTFMGYYAGTNPRDFYFRQRQKGGLKFTEIIGYDIQQAGTCSGYSPKPAWCYCDDIYDYSTKCLDRIADVGYFNVFGCDKNKTAWDGINHGWNAFYPRGNKNGLFFSEKTNGINATAVINDYDPHDDVTCYWSRNLWAPENGQTFWIVGFQVYIYGC